MKEFRRRLSQGMQGLQSFPEKEYILVPYEKLTDLPDNVRDNLPKHAQEIYQAAYNSAEEQYDEEDRAHRVAWSAVKNKYEKDEESGEWVPKEED